MDARTLPKPRGGARGRERMAPYLFLAMEAGRELTGSARFALGDVDVVVIGRGDRRGAARTVVHGVRTLRIDVPDPWMSNQHARIERRGAECTLADAGSRNGSSINDVPVDGAALLRDGDVIELGGTFFLFRAAEPELADPDLLAPAPRAAIRTVNPRLSQRLGDLLRVAATDVSVVLHGASGTGKEVLAQAVHGWSGRKGAFVAVNCGALPATLVESELFGYVRGAFSGAVDSKVGLIAAADRGTLFLDEIGDLPAAAQPALLRALQERAVTPVGATEPVPVDFRLISATHRDLSAMVAAGSFREDLWARLAGFALDLPPLAARREDLATLIADLAARRAPGRDVAFSADAARALLGYAWPRNVRELEKVLAAALALAGGGEIDLPHLPETFGSADTAPLPVADDGDPRRDELIAALRAHKGNVSATARALGRPRSQVQRWMRRWNLRPEDFG
jgi:transcriptional regulator of acetoin/glycerol metabolism